MGSEGLDELVAARVLLVVGLDTGNGVGISIGRVDHDVVGALDALPTIIAVHGPITARDGGNASVATGLLGDLSQEGAEPVSYTHLDVYKRQVNRRVNAELANQTRSAGAAQHQLALIDELEQRGLRDALPDALAVFCDLRERYPDLSLRDLRCV